MSNFVVITVSANGLTLLLRSRKHTRLTLDDSELDDIVSFTTGTDVSLLLNAQEKSSIEHDINSKHPVGIAGIVICAFFSLFNII